MTPEWETAYEQAPKTGLKTEYYTRKRTRELDNVPFLRRYPSPLKKLILWALL